MINQVPPFLLLDESIQLRLRHKHTHRLSILIFLFFSGDSELDGVELAEQLVELHSVYGALFISGASP